MNSIAERVLELAVQIQQIAAPTFIEEARGNFVRGLFDAEALKDISIDSRGNVAARLPGRQPGKKPLIVSAHLDTVFPGNTNLQVRREDGRIIAPGIGDNSLGVAALLGILWSLRERNITLEHDLWLVANTGEEGLGNLYGMRGVVERFGGRVIAYLVLEGLALGHVYHRAVGVKRYRIQANTAGGHSWSDFGKPSAVHELASIVTRLTSLRLPRNPRTTLNVGSIHGGTGVNVLAAEAKCELDLRSENMRTLSRLIQRVEKILSGAQREGLAILSEAIGERPAGEISAEHPLVNLARQCLYTQGVDSILTSGSTDANIPLSMGHPALVMGISTGGGAHTLHEYINEKPVDQGLASVVSFVEGAGAVAG